RRRVPLLHRRARGAHPPQPADRAALARDHAERRESRADRVLAPLREGRRPDLRARGDGGRRLRGRRRARPDRGDGPKEARPRRRQALDPARMTQAAWICLFLPLAAAVAITLLGTSISRRTAGWISTL